MFDGKRISTNIPERYDASTDAFSATAIHVRTNALSMDVFDREIHENT